MWQPCDCHMTSLWPCSCCCFYLASVHSLVHSAHMHMHTHAHTRTHMHTCMHICIHTCHTFCSILSLFPLLCCCVALDVADASGGVGGSLLKAVGEDRIPREKSSDWFSWNGNSGAPLPDVSQLLNSLTCLLIFNEECHLLMNICGSVVSNLASYSCKYLRYM